MKSRIISVIKWSERYTNTDMLYLVKGGSWLTLGQLVTFISSLILVWVLANFIPKADYGIYKYIISIFTLLSISTLSGMGTSISRSVAKGKDGGVKKAIITKIKWGLLGLIGSIGVAAYYVMKGNIDFAIIFIVISILIPFGETFADYQQYLQGRKDFKNLAKYRVLQRLIISTLVISSVFLTKNIYIIVFIYLLSFSLLNILMFYLSIRKYRINDIPDEETINYGYHLSVMGVLRLTANQIDKILLFYYLGPIALASYYFAVAIPQEMSSLFSQINSLAFPKFSERKDYDGKNLLKKIFKMSLILIIPVAIYILTSPLLFNLFFSEYTNVVKYSQVFSLNMILIPFMLINTMFSAQGNTKILYITNIIEPVILISLFIILIPIFGIWGVIYSILIKSVVHSTILTSLLLKRR